MATLPPLVRTKLAPPLVGRAVLHRSRLLDELRLHLEKRLILVCAGAGYGKTLLLATLLREASVPFLWYRLEEGDRDPAVFLAYLLEGLSAQVPGFAAEVRGKVEEIRRFALGPEALLAVLVNGLIQTVQGPLLIALDDFHHVDAGEVPAAVDYLLDHLPPAIHLIIASRTKPRLALARLRARGELAEIGTTELRFTVEEIEELFQRVFRRPLDAASLHTLAAQTEGWAVGLVLVYHAMRKKPPAQAREVIAHLKGSRIHLDEYLEDEVLRHQPAEVQRFLLQTAVFSRLSPAACDRMLDRDDSAQFLRYLERNHLLIEPLDDERSAYRYHPLFQEYLLRRTERDEGIAGMQMLRARAAAALEEIGDWEGAIDLALVAGAHDMAARVIDEVAEACLAAGLFSTLRRRIESLPPHVQENHPWLLVHLTRALEVQGEWEAAAVAVERARARFQQRADARGLWASLRESAWICFRRGRYQEGIRLGHEALAHLDAGQRAERAQTYYLLAACLAECGDLAAARTYWEEALALLEQYDDRIWRARVLHAMARNYYYVRGDLATSQRMEEEALRLCREVNSQHGICHALVGLGGVYFARGEDPQALALFEEALETARALGYRMMEGYALVYLGDTFREMRDLARSHRYYEEAGAIARRLQEPSVLHGYLRGLGRLAWIQGQLAEALEMVSTALDTIRQIGYQVLIAESLVDRGLLLSELDRTEEGLRAVREGLQMLRRWEARYEMTRAHLYLAHLLRKSGGEGETTFQEHLRAALTLAGEYGYHSLLVQRERRITLPLLVTALRLSLELPYVKSLLKRMGASAAAAVLPLLDDPHPAVRQAACEVLEESGERRVIGSLKRHLQDPDTVVRLRIKETLERLRRLPPPPLRVYCLGRFKVVQGDRLIPGSVWPSQKAQELLAYLVTRLPRRVPREVIQEVLWPAADGRSASGVFHSTLYLLRRALEPEMEEGIGSAYIVQYQSLYGLSERVDCWVDVDAFVSRCHQAQGADASGDTGEAIRLWGEAESLYAGDFLEEFPYAEWTISERERLREAYVQALEKLAEGWLRTGEYPRSIEYGRKAIAADPCREGAYRLLMQALALSGQRAEALRWFRECASTLQREFGTAPSPETVALYRSLLTS
ncbi:MAG: BTAD domain-containing putative transcriptional regulator [Armatimonadota bacterium]|nr:BTAD domain-containing putative transcriptional regulator [Armatimonadota bacterium]